jgi:acetylornithine deacetylase
VDPVNVLQLTRDLVDIDSTTGTEHAAGRFLASYLRERGYRVVEQPVGNRRVNLYATRSEPVVVLSTHYDCVPPHFPSDARDGLLFGRGSCDAKGILTAQVAAADALAASGEQRVGLLFLVGEEHGSDGARRANELAPHCRYLVGGEPTDSRLGVASRGVLRVKLKAAGRAAHSAYPERGESAIEKLVDALVALRTLPLPEDPVLGRTSYSVGLVAGGVAPNVVPPSAEAEVVFRTVGDASTLRRILDALHQWVTLDDVIEIPPVRLKTMPGFEAAVFSFTTDIPFLTRWGTPLLFGPGSIHVAHTDHEHVAIDELLAAVPLYVRLVQQLLAQ